MQYCNSVLCSEVLVVVTIVPLSTGENFHDWIHRGLVILLTACPCAIVIGAPLATTCAIAAAATRGLLIKKAETVEMLQLGRISIHLNPGAPISYVGST